VGEIPNFTKLRHPDNNRFVFASVQRHDAFAIYKLIGAGKFRQLTRLVHLGIAQWERHTIGDSSLTTSPCNICWIHAGGWNPVNFAIHDPFAPSNSTDMVVAYPACTRHVISWMFSQPVDFALGTTTSSSKLTGNLSR